MALFCTSTMKFFNKKNFQKKKLQHMLKMHCSVTLSFTAQVKNLMIAPGWTLYERCGVNKP